MTGTRQGDARLGTGGLGPGAVIGSRYRLASVASRSGLDVVLNALDEQARCRVRVRLTAQQVDPELAALEHPGLVPVIDHGVAGRSTYTVHPWFDGHPLRLDPGAEATPSGVRQALRIVIDVLDALEHVHARTRRAHGNFGLHSLWLGDDGRPRILDVATPQGVLTPAALPWASPERLRGQPRSPAGDVYAVGAILFALITGAPPFGDEPIDARAGHLMRAVPDIPGLPPAVVRLLHTALHKQADRRFATAGHMRAAARTILVELEGDATPAPMTGRDTTTPPSLEPRLTALVDDDSTMAGGRLAPGPAPTERRGRAFLLYALAGLCVGVVAGVLLVLLVSTVGLAWYGATLAFPGEAPVAAAPAPAATPTEPAVVDAAPAVPAAPQPPYWAKIPVQLDGAAASPLDAFRDFERDVRAWDGEVLLVGHTDDRGTLQSNYRIGLGRAWAVQQLLVARGIDEDKLPLATAGETRPLSTNSSPDGRARNRRVSAEFKAAPPRD